jgi:hypothetical protein
VFDAATEILQKIPLDDRHTCSRAACAILHFDVAFVSFIHLTGKYSYFVFLGPGLYVVRNTVVHLTAISLLP